MQWLMQSVPVATLPFRMQGGITWTRIASTVLVGAKSIPLVEAVQWKAGDKFVLTTTSWKDEIVNQNEVLTVASVANGGLTVNTVEALQFNHYGTCLSVA
jgi:hypothetical protein